MMLRREWTGLTFGEANAQLMLEVESTARGLLGIACQTTA